jgi:hypothetical protein
MRVTFNASGTFGKSTTLFTPTSLALYTCKYTTVRTLIKHKAKDTGFQVSVIACFLDSPPHQLVHGASQGDYNLALLQLEYFVLLHSISLNNI